MLITYFQMSKQQLNKAYNNKFSPLLLAMYPTDFLKIKIWGRENEILPWRVNYKKKTTPDL